MRGAVTDRGQGGHLCLAADMMVILPVLVLAEAATVAGCVTTATCLTRLPPTVPAALKMIKLPFISYKFVKGFLAVTFLLLVISS